MHTRKLFRTPYPEPFAAPQMLELLSSSRNIEDRCIPKTDVDVRELWCFRCADNTWNKVMDISGKGQELLTLEFEAFKFLGMVKESII